jgi:aspartyl-tRNA(Asn)/glutamyl-tRNA(Gln) amidotransferase subunit A
VNINPFNTIKEWSELLTKKEITTSEITQLYRQRFARYDKELGSALELFDIESTGEQNATHKAPLSGIPGLIKDNICQQGHITSCASKILEHYKAPYDATVITRLKQAGGIMLGRANMDEFAMGSSTETSAYQKTVNPWDHTKVPGGSCGGSAAAVAAGLVPWALGSETGGSIRQPAALCGIVGFRPTYGLVSRYGLVAYGSSLDQIAPITRTVYDNALILSIIAGHDDYDSTSTATSKYSFTQELTGSIRSGITIGVIQNFMEAPGIDPQVLKALQEVLDTYQKMGATIKYVTLPSVNYSAAIYFMISRAEAASNLSRFDGIRYGSRGTGITNLSELYEKTRQQLFGAEVKRRILLGNYVLSAGHADRYYQSARIMRQVMRDELYESFKDVDLLFAPVSPTAAFSLGAFDNDRLTMDLQDLFTAPSSLTGTPALSIPCGFTNEHLPIGFQLMGPDYSESLLYQTGHAYQMATDWHTRYPAIYL